MKGSSSTGSFGSMTTRVPAVEAGVENVEVDLPKGVAYVEGSHQEADIISAIEAAGFSCRLLQE